MSGEVQRHRGGFTAAGNRENRAVSPFRKQRLQTASQTRIWFERQNRRSWKQDPRYFDKLPLVSSDIQDRSDTLRPEPRFVEEAIKIARTVISSHLGVGRILPDIAETRYALAYLFEKPPESFHAAKVDSNRITPGPPRSIAPDTARPHGSSTMNRFFRGYHEADPVRENGVLVES